MKNLILLFLTTFSFVVNAGNSPVIWGPGPTALFLAPISLQPPTGGSTYLSGISTGPLTGVNVTSVGVGAGAVDSSGANNTFVGENAGNGVTTGSFNTIIGSQDNAIGIPTTGSRNTILGYKVNTGGAAYSDQVAIGYLAGTSGFGGSGDVVIGALAQGNISNTLGTTAATVSIGYSANGNASYAYNGTVTVGAFSAAGGNGSIVLGQGMQTNSANTFVAGQGGNTVATDYLATSAAGQISFGSSTHAMGDLFLGSGAAPVAAPAPGSINLAPVVAGTLDTAGASLTLRGGNSTGAGAGGPIIFQTAAAGVSSTTVNTLAEVLRIDQFGHIIAKGTTTTMGACGTSPSVAGNDTAGVITVGTGGVATSCTLTFAKTWGTVPHCFVADETQIIALQVVPSAATLVVTAAAAFTASSKLDYHCVNHQ